MSAAASHVDQLPAFLERLVVGMGRDEPMENATSSARTSGSWHDRLDASLPTLGLKAQWLVGGGDIALAESRPDLPLVTYVEHPRGGDFVSVTGGRLGKVRIQRGVGGTDAWVDPVTVFGTEPRTWARVLPTLPATPLSCDTGLPKAPFRRLLSLLQAERQDVGVVVVFAVVIGIFSLATPLAIQLLINWLAFGALLQPIITLGVGLVLILTFVGVLRAAQRHAVEIIQRRIFARTVSDLSARLARVRIEGFDGAYGPELANRFFDVLTVQKATSTLLLDGLAAALQAGVGLLLLAFYHPYLLFFDIVVVFFVAVVLLGLARGAEASAIVESKKKYATAAWLEEIARHPMVFKLSGTQLAERRTDGLASAYLGAREAHFRVFFRQYLGMQTIAVILPAALLVMTGWLVMEGQLTLGQLVAAEFIVASALAGVAKFTDKLETVYDLLAGVDKLGGLFDLPLHRKDGATRLDREHPASATLRDVSFVHPMHPLSVGPIDLELTPGASVAVVGDTSAGPSLLAELLVGARTPTSGVVLRDGQPIETLRPFEVFEEALLLSHEGLFAGTLRDNLDLGAGVADETLWLTLEEVGLAERIRTWPEGLDTELTPDGQPLSRVEVRGLFVARAQTLQPRLLVVDGLLDGAPPALCSRWLDVLTSPRCTWTLVLFTHDPDLADGLPTAFDYRGGTLHVRSDR